MLIRRTMLDSYEENYSVAEIYYFSRLQQFTNNKSKNKNKNIQSNSSEILRFNKQYIKINKITINKLIVYETNFNIFLVNNILVYDSIEIGRSEENETLTSQLHYQKKTKETEEKKFNINGC